MTERLWLKIGEAAQRIGARPKELRYWERVIPGLRPRRSIGNLRYYHVDELPQLLRIQEWLKEGYTVADCRELLLMERLERPQDEGLDTGLVELPAPAGCAVAPPQNGPASASRLDLRPIVEALRYLVEHLSKPWFPR